MINFFSKEQTKMIDFVSCHASETLVLNMGEMKYRTVFQILELLHIVTVEMSQQFFELVPNCSQSPIVCTFCIKKTMLLLSRERTIQVQMPKTLLKMIHEKCVK